MEIDKPIVSTIIVGLALNIAAGVVSFYLTKDSTTTFATVAITELLVILEVSRRLLTRPHVPGVLRYRSTPPIGGELLDIAQSVTSEFLFWGISAKTIIHSDDFRQILVMKSRGKRRFRFLILDPESEHVIKRAAEEGDTPHGWQREIEANIDRLQQLRTQHGLNIEVRLYDAAPVFRLIFIDSNMMYLGWYPMESQGVHSPLLVVTNGANSIYGPVRTLFEETWLTSKEV